MPQNGLLDGKVAVITGAGAGIGKAVAELFMREGAQILAVDWSGEQERVAADLGAAVVPFHADVSREDDVAAMFAKALDTFGRVDAAVHVAGGGGGRGAEQVTMKEYDELTAANLRGVLLCTEHAVRAMLPNGGGAIVNISSVASLNADNRISPVYAVYYGDRGIRANAVAPGFTLSDTNLATPPEAMRELLAKSPMGRGARTEEQAEIVAFLCSDLASFVTGAIIPVDGGWSARLA